MAPAKTSRQGRWVAIVLWESLLIFKLPNLLLVRSYFKDRLIEPVGIVATLLACCIATSLPDLLEAASKLAIELSEFMDLGDFNILCLGLP